MSFHASLDLNLLSIVAFLLLMAYLVWRDRDNLERYSVIFIRRTGRGINMLERLASSHPKFWKYWSTLGVVAGFGIMAWITWLIFEQTLRLFLVADAVPPVGPVLPTVSTVTNPAQAGYLGLPFWHFVISLSVVLVAHEMMHGVIARVEGFDVESVGVVFFTIIPIGAFVQPEGQKDFFESDKEDEGGRWMWDEGSVLSRLRVLAAGPASNITVALVLAVVLLGAFTQAHGGFELRGFYEHEGMRIVNVSDGSPAERAGLSRGMVVTSIGGRRTLDIRGFQEATANLSVGQNVTVETLGNGTFHVVLGEGPGSGGNFTYRPATVDYLLVPLERSWPGTIEFYEDINDWIVEDDTRVRIERWRWISENYPGLEERAQENIERLEAELPEEREEGFMGVRVIPEREVKEGLEPFEGPLLLVLQVLFFVALLNFMIGAANLLPIKGLDGGWMLSIALAQYAPGIERRTTRYVTLFTILMIVISFAFLIGRFIS